MENTKIWLSSPHMGGNEQSYINEAFESNWIAPLGPNVNGFEQDIQKYLSGNNEVYVAALSSGTAALHLSLVMLGVEHGDEVICQSMTFSASANPIMYQGATPIFVDSEPETWNICPNALETAIKDRISKGKKPKAIIAVHLYGMPFKADEILAISKKYDIPVVEDSAEALGSTYKGRKCGTLGNFGILSFNGNKIITTSGGGALVCHNEEDKNKTVFLSTQARDNAPHYQHSHVGYNYRMSNICAGIGRGQMEVLDSHVAKRREMNSFYKNLFQYNEAVTVLTEPSKDYFSNHWLTAITIEPKLFKGVTREDIRKSLDAENIESRPLWKPMHMQPVFEKYPYYGGIISEELFKNGLCLPSGSNLTDEEKSRIDKVIKSYL
ncbi:pyridoxal phosphate-dependent aminotransferase [Flavobacterium suaedae]|uniref:Pyridoxal phosphate-dependent aminotransferase n=1 Tax=Flavobacterium suaedae TaxID=1767027 RepID=A0ABQ1JQD7_9FLAO|nr:aminotransferase class I/II-fold pyridoxal phosphate-dependent enzyme [Flavobacterium suaedae]GGB72143.1 pyridoxal phosphate-dependent aminotransferase [Flavobacterium suaedae]